MKKNYFFLLPRKRFACAMLKIALSFLLAAIPAMEVRPQCSGCTLMDPSPADPQNYTLTVNDGDVVCITEDKTFGSMQLNGGTLCIGPGATLTISNNVYSSADATVNMEIYGTLEFNQVVTFYSTLRVVIHETGSLMSGTIGNGNDIFFNGRGLTTIANYGLMHMGVLTFANTNTGKYLFDNHGTLSISRNINMHANETVFRNSIGGVITVGANFSINKNGSFYNCGTIDVKHGFNHRGWIENIGEFRVTGNINYSTDSPDDPKPRLDNFGIFELKDGNVQLNGVNSVFYNEGSVTITNGTFEREGSLEGPAVGSGKRGFIYFDTPAGLNSGSIGPNLNFKNTAAGGVSSFNVMFQNRPLTQLSGISWDCEGSGNCTAPKYTPENYCFNFDGDPINVEVYLTALNDYYYDILPDSVLNSMLDNDKRSDKQPIVIGTSSGQVSLSTVVDAKGTAGSWPAGFTLNQDGTIKVAPGVSEGKYELYYKICLQPDITVCDVAKVEINVISGSKGGPVLWVGSHSTDPTVGGNWSGGVVPQPGDDVEFATQANNPGNPAVRDLKTKVDMSIGNLTNASDKNLIISEETSLVINGKITITDPVTGLPSTDPTKIQVKAASGKANGSLLINCAENSTMQDGINVPNSVYATVELYAKGKKGHQYSWLDTISGSPTYNTVTYTGDYRWQHFGVPVKSIKASDAFYGAFLREYSESQNADGSYFSKWIVLNNESNLTKFKGYEITQDAPTKYSIQGELIFCDQDITLTHSATVVAGSIDTNQYNRRYGLGQNIFGNSFTASILISEMMFPAGVESTVYMYNTGTFGEWAALDRATTNDQAQTAGNYIAIPKGTADLMEYGKIPSMQGFLLRHLAYGENESPITMRLYYDDISDNTKPQLAPKFNNGKTNDELGFVRVQLSSKSTIDNLWLFSRAGTSENYDEGWDGRKYFGTPTAFIFADTPDGPMQVSTTETIDGNVISFYPNGDKEYVFTIIKSNLDNYQNLHLVDMAAKSVVSLHSDTTVYRFTADKADKINKRFVIVDKDGGQINLDGDEFDLLDAYASGNNVITAVNFTGKNGGISIYDVAGSIVMNDTMMTGTNQYQPNLKPGTYILSLSASGRQKSIKILIKP